MNGFWERVQDEIRARVSDGQFETWFTRTSCDWDGASSIEVQVPNGFYSEWIQRQYTTIVRESIEAVIGQKSPVVSFVVAAGQPEPIPAPARVLTPPAGVPQESSIDQERLDRSIRELELNPTYTLDNFVVGPSNRLAHAAAQAVIENTGRVYNPLFIHGGIGLGKTHLLQGICHSVLRARPKTHIRYIPCEQFVNQFITALGKNKLDEFRNQYRHVDVLVIDDIHFLASKDHTQEEFFHTFNSLYNQQKQIILSSDSPPKEIPTLEERLVSRFKWGLVCEVEPPTFETRMAIVAKKARLCPEPVPEEVTEFLAGAIKGNVRELEGAVTRLVGYSRIMKRSITLDMARETLSDLLGSSRRRISIDQIVGLVTEYYGVRLSDLQSKKRFQSIAMPRQICMYLARQYTPLSLAEIGGYFGGRDHTTVLYGIDKITRALKGDLDLRAALQELKRRLEA